MQAIGVRQVSATALQEHRLAHSRLTLGELGTFGGVRRASNGWRDGPAEW